jgi:hypothetical protein
MFQTEKYLAGNKTIKCLEVYITIDKIKQILWYEYSVRNTEELRKEG